MHTWDSSGWQLLEDCTLCLGVGPPEGPWGWDTEVPAPIYDPYRASPGAMAPWVLPAVPCVGWTHSHSQKNPRGRKWQLFAARSHLCTEKGLMLRAWRWPPTEPEYLNERSTQERRSLHTTVNHIRNALLNWLSRNQVGTCCTINSILH